MTRREWGTWLEGGTSSPGTEPAAGRRTEGPGEQHRGARLGLPQHGSGAMASTLRRLVALVIDWGACMLVAYLLWHTTMGLRPLAVFAVENLILVASIGGTIGHRLLGLRVIRLGRQGRLPGTGLISAVVRTLLLCLVLPAVVWDADGRGMHDRAAGTVMVRR